MAAYVIQVLKFYWLRRNVGDLREADFEIHQSFARFIAQSLSSKTAERSSAIKPTVLKNGPDKSLPNKANLQ